MKKQCKEILINPSEIERLTQEPLMAFSFYLSSRNNALLSISDEIIDNLDKGFSTSTIQGGSISHASNLMWLWTLGAYEVIRTIYQAKECFSENFSKNIYDLKNDLAKARMPSSKMEKKGQKIPVNSNRSPDEWNVSNKDLLIGDPEDPISCRMILEKYDAVMSSLTIEDVKKRHEDSYNKL